jgi:hypothetical protein
MYEYKTFYATTERVGGQDEIGESALKSLQGVYAELVQIDDPEDHEPTERDYKYLDA